MNWWNKQHPPVHDFIGQGMQAAHGDHEVMLVLKPSSSFEMLNVYWFV